MGTQHSGLREDNNNINSLFNYLFSSHAPRLLSERSFATESGEEAVCQLRLTTELV